MPPAQPSATKRSPNRSAGSGAPQTPQPQLDGAPPMKQHRGLLLVLLAIFFAWIAILLVMYFTTVRTHGGRLEPLPLPPTSATPAAPATNHTTP